MSLRLPEGPKANEEYRKYLVDKLTISVFGGTRYQYLRPSYIDEVATKTYIRHIVFNDESLIALNMSKKKKQALVKQIEKYGQRMFIMSIIGSMTMAELQLILGACYRDSGIPFSEVKIEDGNLNTVFARLRSAQFCFPPIFRQGSFTDVLPPKSRIPIDYESQHPLGDGAAGYVYKASIDDECRDFPTTHTGLPNIEPKHKFALKKAKEGSTQVAREEQFLEALYANKISHPHITTSYTGFKFDKQFYLVSELGSSDLFAFMKKYDKSDNIGISKPWLLEQLKGLAKALAAVHEPVEGHTGLHHDISPKNILVFADQKHTLKLTDWGCAAIKPGKHDSTSRGNPGYHPPEAAGTKSTGSPHDVWSLGCVFLELLVWFAQGKPAHQELWRNLEKDADYSKKGWYVERGVEEPVTSPTVVLKMDYLAAMPSSQWKPIVPTIRKMLTINPDRRITAAQLVKELL